MYFNTPAEFILIRLTRCIFGSSLRKHASLVAEVQGKNMGIKNYPFSTINVYFSSKIVTATSI